MPTKTTPINPTPTAGPDEGSGVTVASKVTEEVKAVNTRVPSAVPTVSSVQSKNVTGPVIGESSGLANHITFEFMLDWRS
jgi:hypothetical protein